MRTHGGYSESTANAALGWIGAGRPIFVGEFGEGFAFPLLVRSNAELIGADAKGASSASLDEIAAFFSAGGSACYLLNSPNLEPPIDSEAVAAFVGEDSVSGYRSGLHAISDVEDGTTIVVPGRLDDVVETAFVEYILNRPSKTLVLERAPVLEGGLLGGEEPEEKAVLPAIFEALCRVVSLGRAPGGGQSLSALGAAVGAYFAEEARIEATDGVPFLFSSGVDLPTVGERFGCLSALRRWQGLRRSIDLGTRWILFEVQDEFLCRRVEREVRALLLELHQRGFFAGVTPDRSFSVACKARVESEPCRATGRIELSVAARVRGGSRETLTRTFDMAIDQ